MGSLRRKEILSTGPSRRRVLEGSTMSSSRPRRWYTSHRSCSRSWEQGCTLSQGRAGPTSFWKVCLVWTGTGCEREGSSRAVPGGGVRG